MQRQQRTPKPQNAAGGRVMRIATAALLAAVLGAQSAMAQSQDAATVPAETPSRWSEAAALAIEAPAASFAVDLGPYDGWVEELTNALREHPSTMGLHRPVPLDKAGDLGPELLWTGEAAMRAAFDVCSRGADNLRARVAATVPAAALVTVFDAEGRNPRGGWTGTDIAEDGTDGAWLPAQEGECLKVMVALPPSADPSSVAVWLRTVAHRFTSAEIEEALTVVRAVAPQSREGGATGVVPRHSRSRHGGPQCRARYVSVCDRLDASDEVIPHATAVGHYHYERDGRSWLCTGTLVNDGKAEQDGPLHPLFLTAAHCVETSAQARSMDVVFDWVASSCSPEVPKPVTGPARLLSTAPEFDQTLVRLAHWPALHSAAGRYALGWNALPVGSGVVTRTLSHPGGAQMAYTRAETRGIGPDVPVDGIGCVRNPVNTLENDGMTESGSSGAALVKRGPGLQIIGVLSHGPREDRICRGEIHATAGYGGFRDFYPRIAQYIGAGP